MRSLICSVSAAFLMLTFTYTIFYWNTGFSNILHVVLSSMVVKLIGGALLMGPSQLTSKLFKKLEGVDVYDLKFKFCQARHQKIMAIFDKNKRKGAE